MVLRPRNGNRLLLSNWETVFMGNSIAEFFYSASYAAATWSRYSLFVAFALFLVAKLLQKLERYVSTH